jgi:response regulator RpfG family c-di-GMP phosphodiesterase
MSARSKVTKDREKRMEAGVSKYVSKPVDLVSLMRVCIHDRPPRKALRASMAV